MIAITKTKKIPFNFTTAVKKIKANKLHMALFPCSGPEKLVKTKQNTGLIEQFKILPSMITKIDNEVRNFGK